MPASARSAGASTVESFAELPMRVGVGQTRDLEEKRLRFLAQLGVEDLLISSLESLPSNDLEPGEPWPFDEVGFSGVMTPDHVPRLDDDPDWGAGGYFGRAFTFGYLKALSHAAGHE